MSKILKNTTITDITVDGIGYTVPASSQIIVEPTDYLLLSLAETITELTAHINIGDIVVNDGAKDLTKEQAIKHQLMLNRGTT